MRELNKMNQFATIEQALDGCQGRMIILYDNDHREQEGI